MKNNKQKLAFERRVLYLRNILRVIVFLILSILGIVFIRKYINVTMLISGIILTCTSVYLLIYSFFYLAISHVVFKYNKKRKYALSNTINLTDIKYHYKKYQELVNNTNWTKIHYNENGVNTIALISSDKKCGFTFANGLYFILDTNKDKPWARVIGKQRSEAVMYDIDRGGVITITGRTKIPTFFNWLEIVTSSRTMDSISLKFKYHV